MVAGKNGREKAIAENIQQEWGENVYSQFIPAFAGNMFGVRGRSEM